MDGRNNDGESFGSQFKSSTRLSILHHQQFATRSSFVRLLFSTFRLILNNWFQIIKFKPNCETRSSIESLRDVNTVSLKHNICIVSIVGQSSLGQNSCKANLVDDALKKTVFAGLFGDQMQLDSDMVR